MVRSLHMNLSDATVGRRLRVARTAVGLTQRQLGAKCGLHMMSIQRYESDAFVPPIKVAKQLADALGVSAPWLVFGVESMA